MYNIFYNKQSRKALYKMPSDISVAIRKKMDEIAKDPMAQRSDVTPLKGRSGYRMRVGSWRVIYSVNKGRLEILVIKIASRGDVYK